MKKYIISEIFLLFSSALLLYFTITRIELAVNHFHNMDYYNSIQNLGSSELYKQAGINSIVLSCLSFIAVVGNAFVVFMILKNFKPLVENHIKIIIEEKEKRLQSKAEKAEAAKQAKIEKLKNELEELTKD